MLLTIYLPAYRKLVLSSAANQNLYPAVQANFPYLVVSKNAIKGQRLQLNLRSLLSIKLFRLERDSSTDFCYDYKEDEASGAVLRGARVNSVLHIKHKPTWCFN